ncbi:MAG: transketolase [Actinobacteria bacterium]|nr:transketolase [Actinomycetota bacterium]
MSKKLDQLCINTIKLLAAEAVQKANSGHPGMPMGAATMAYVLWTKFLKHNPKNPSWLNRDRFILSAGHGSMLLYSMLHLTGYDVSLDEIKSFRQWGSITPGHPEYGLTPGVETTTGPLGQGFANGVGMAIVQKFLAQKFNRSKFKIIDHFIYAIAGDGDMMEGISHEAASLAGHLHLGNIIYLYDDNKISIEGSTELAFTESVDKRFKAYGWHVQRINGDDIEEIENAIRIAQKNEFRPSLIITRTHIANGSPNKHDSAEAHGAPLGEDEIKLIKRAFDWPAEPSFYIPPQVLEHFRKAVEIGMNTEDEWNLFFERYKNKFPELAKEFEDFFLRRLPEGWKDALPSFSPQDKPTATRAASGKTLNALAEKVKNLIGGSADLAPSNNTYIKSEKDFQFQNYGSRNIHFGVREHVMGSILNGMAVYGSVIPYGGTFLVFSDYMRPAIRLAALMELPVIFIFTHDSIGVGEDGPTHQPVEHLAALRAIPGLTVIRPADATETVEAWRLAIENKKGPIALVLTRQNLPILDRSSFAPASMLEKGAYVLWQPEKKTPDILLIATGSEVHLCLEAGKTLQERGINARIISMPARNLFESQPDEYRESVLPLQVKKRIVVEAGCSFGWYKYSGDDGIIISIDRFGASAPAGILFENFGFTVQNIVEKALSLF